jgi:predicted heme/steroid binding protein
VCNCPWFSSGSLADGPFIAHLFTSAGRTPLAPKQRTTRGDTMVGTRFIAAAATIATACTFTAAEEFVFFANLSGLNEVPANDSPAIGFFTGVFDDTNDSFSFSWLITDNLVGTPSSPGAHIHFAPAGSNGPIVFGFASAAWDLSGSAVWEDMSQESIDRLFAGDLYANFHTTAFPGGEVRGQIALVPAPGALGLAACGALVFVRRRRG